VPAGIDAVIGELAPTALRGIVVKALNRREIAYWRTEASLSLEG
jgi:hypothetical protein